MYKVIPVKLLYYFLYFGVMSFIGWIIEVIYRSCKEKRPVNPGFLSGPFLPIYGFGAVIITAVNVEAKTLSPVLGWAITLISPTVLEYFGGWIMEKFFNMKLWDYHKQRFNLQGRICLRFSIYWAALAAVLILVIQPRVYTRISILGPYLSHFFAGALFAYILFDLTYSIKAMTNFKAFQQDLALLIEKGKQYHSVFEFAEDGKGKILKLPEEVKRILKPLNAFPSLRQDFKAKLPVFPDWIKKHLENRFWKELI
ncbi:putative ABC transporter permease [Leadbettera azotonutricia]|uniref:Metal dependent phosphohydrolase n=1 Tax=Leadbettera azotonutricia (strain ATCC BAA-888 / DSM 13862 / ZAS-9) TaxID=545695 RepID=F5YAL9_LEAAZ|nr:putative ABC transporter permease [Leadbettera azotonutricia]AEF80749.1 metal dependent phosphohydrolase [Leadbettera azotonutricia ZAS-9]